MRTAIFVDGANLYLSTVNLGWQVDFNKVRDVFGHGPDLYRAYYFTALPPRDRSANIHKLADFLRSNGWQVVSKQMKERIQEEVDMDGKPIIRVKGNMDVELVVYALRAIEDYDHGVFFTGDGDFRYLLEELMNNGLKTTVVSSFNCHNPICSIELKQQADWFVDLADSKWRAKLEKRPAFEPVPLQHTAVAATVAVRRRTFFSRRKA